MKTTSHPCAPPSRLEQELARAGVLVADGPCENATAYPVQRGADASRRGSEPERSPRPSGDVAAPSSHARTGARVSPVLSAEDLHLDVPRAHHRLARGTSGRLRMRWPPRAWPRPARGRDHRTSSTRRMPRPAAAGDRLGEEREPDVLRLGDESIDVVGGFRVWEDGHARLDRMTLRLDLVPRHLQDFGGRTDEHDAVGCSLLGQLRVLREEAVSGVDRIRSRFESDADDLVDAEVCAHRMAALPDLVGPSSALSRCTEPRSS